MNALTNVDVDEATRTALAALALGDPDLLGESLELRAELQRRSGLDPRSFALVKIAALMALDAPPASYLWQVSNALEAAPPRKTSSASCWPSRRRSAAPEQWRPRQSSWWPWACPCRTACRTVTAQPARRQ